MIVDFGLFSCTRQQRQIMQHLPWFVSRPATPARMLAKRFGFAPEVAG
jgi:hypothetical protein